MTARRWWRSALAAVIVMSTAAGCGWRGVNSMPLPGTKGGGPGSYLIQAQLPDVTNIQQNSPVQVGDVTVGSVTKIERQGWHALLTMRLAGNVDLPANATVKVGQTSLLGSLHVELGSPVSTPPQGKLHNGSVIPLVSATSYPTTEQTLSTVGMLLNGGGIGRVQEITQAFSTAFSGREQDLRSLLQQLDTFIGNLDAQTSDIIAATERFNDLVGKFAAHKDVLDRALRTIPDALAVLRDQRTHLADAFEQMSKFGVLSANAINKTKQNIVNQLNEFGPVLQSLADAGPAMTRALSVLATFPDPNEGIENWIRGDAGNVTVVLDLTLSRIDETLFTGTRWEGNLTQLELQWGRTIGQFPSPATAANPLIAPYHFDQGR
ncbi:MCE family protein [Mycobacterium sp. Aquia_216]|uniref:MCE family protein n=1 Tax=Mycobacterium sp. Aquia_216 TaxID=2991729 RepID=UPI00227B7213|nr:MCE family protein [Mycobacterium sp. Aquia_216]WAJ44322.1 MCE family protein [Mycobacterium sp. Aquia_216]